MSAFDSFPAAVAAIRAFAHALATRPDVELRIYAIEPPAPAELLAQLHDRVPDEWLALAAVANGICICWEFMKRNTGKGLLQIPALTADTAFKPNSPYDHWLGPDRWHLDLDFSYSAGTRWVADGPADRRKPQLFFVRYGHDEAAQPMGHSLAQYLHRALAAGLADDWPLAEHRPDVQAVIQRILKPAATTIVAGTRIESSHLNHFHRGEVLQTHPVDPAGELARRTTRARSGHFALIRYDLGFTFWQSFDHLKALPKKPDLYETLRRDPWLLVRWGETEGWEAALRRMALMWGPARPGGHEAPDRVIAALLRPLSLTEGADLLRRVAAGVAASGLNLNAPLPLPEAERSLAQRRAAEWRIFHWEQEAYTPLQMLASGYCARVLVEPEAGREALALETLDELEAFAVWHKSQPFYKARHLLTLNNATYKIHFEMPSPELPGNYPIITGLP